jgi:hypothetical protein
MNADYSPKAPQGEPAVAASLDSPLTAVAAAIDAGGDGFWIGGTTDGGRTWSNFFQSPLIGGGPAFAGDPALAYSRREHAFLFAYQPANPGDGSSEIHVIVSRDAGKSWTPAYLASVAASNRRPDGSYDGHFLLHGPKIEVDNIRTSPHYGRVYVAYPRAHFPDGWAPLGAHASDACPAELAYTDSVPVDKPASATWSITPLATSADENRWVTPVVDDQGGLDVVYGQTDCIDGETHAFWFTRSTDGGQTFSPRVRIDKPGEFAGNPDPSQHLPNKNLAIQYSPGFAFNPVTHSLSMITANLAHAATSGADITLQQSRDYGRTWTSARTISLGDDGAPARNDQFFPALTASPAGALNAIFLDNRRDPANHWIDTFQARSTDDGKTWRNFRISSQQWDPDRSLFDCGCFAGDYISIASSARAIYPVWTDARTTPPGASGQTDIFTNVEIGQPENLR